MVSVVVKVILVVDVDELLAVVWLMNEKGVDKSLLLKVSNESSSCSGTLQVTIVIEGFGERKKKMMNKKRSGHGEGKSSGDEDFE
jgi:hypothetical protein